MWQIIGIAGVFGAIAAGYMIEGGKFGVILHAAGPELLTIFGAGIMTMLIGQDIGTLKKVVSGMKKIFAGPCWKKADYTDALCLMFMLARVARQDGNMALEKHIETPSSSPIFSRSPRLCADHHLIHFITDVFRSITMNFTDPHTVGEMMETELAKHHAEALRAPKALATMADALPALGIVAAVLGVVIAMGSISEPPEILGHMIASALVGTLLGVFLSYGLVGPMAGRMKGVLEEEAQMMAMVRQVVISHLGGLAPQLSVEVGRKSVPSQFQPSFEELDQMVTEAAKSLRTEGKAG